MASAWHKDWRLETRQPAGPIPQKIRKCGRRPPWTTSQQGWSGVGRVTLPLGQERWETHLPNGRTHVNHFHEFRGCLHAPYCLCRIQQVMQDMCIRARPRCPGLTVLSCAQQGLIKYHRCTLLVRRNVFAECCIAPGSGRPARARAKTCGHISLPLWLPCFVATTPCLVGKRPQHFNLSDGKDTQNFASGHHGTDR